MLIGLSIDASVRSILQHGDAISRSTSRMSSGLRVRNAADDAGGLALSESIRAQERGYRQATANLQDAMHLLRLGLDGLTAVNDVLQRMREIAVQAANGTNGATAQAAFAAEWAQDLNALTDARAIAAMARLDFSLPLGARQIVVQAGPDQGHTITISYEALRTAFVGAAATLGLMAPNAAGAITAVDNVISAMTTQEAALGAAHSRLSWALESAREAYEEEAGSYSRIRHADFATEATALARANILQAGMGRVAQMHQISRAAALTLLDGGAR